LSEQEQAAVDDAAALQTRRVLHAQARVAEHLPFWDSSRLADWLGRFERHVGDTLTGTLPIDSEQI
jgi:hypothetical protein